MESTANLNLLTKNAYQNGLNYLKEARRELESAKKQLSREDYCRLSDEKAEMLAHWASEHTNCDEPNLQTVEDARHLFQEARTLAYNHQLIDLLSRQIDRMNYIIDTIENPPEETPRNLVVTFIKVAIFLISLIGSLIALAT